MGSEGLFFTAETQRRRVLGVLNRLATRVCPRPHPAGRLGRDGTTKDTKSSPSYLGDRRRTAKTQRAQSSQKSQRFIGVLFGTAEALRRRGPIIRVSAPQRLSASAPQRLSASAPQRFRFLGSLTVQVPGSVGANLILPSKGTPATGRTLCSPLPNWFRVPRVFGGSVSRSNLTLGHAAGEGHVVEADYGGALVVAQEDGVAAELGGGEG
jgi:hypothetical protein